jgi:hypothetical protein
MVKYMLTSLSNTSGNANRSRDCFSLEKGTAHAPKTCTTGTTNSAQLNSTWSDPMKDMALGEDLQSLRVLKQ